jgi:hypothetical protein
MDISLHLLLIFAIIMLGIAAYLAWFKDDAKRQYKRGFVPGPKNIHAYTILYKGFTLFILLGIITMYILGITGVFD